MSNNCGTKDYLSRITGIQGTHKVLFNPLSCEYKIASTNGNFYTGRNSTWTTVCIGSEYDCKKYINKKTF